MLSLNKWCQENAPTYASNCNELLPGQNVLVKYQTDSFDDLSWKRARILFKDDM